jgi:HEAT repeat protein
MNISNRKVDTSKKNINKLIETLKSKDGIARQTARNSLIIIGEPALNALIKAFKIKEKTVHWEVAKALGQIGTKKAARVLVDALEDHDFSVRWIAAEGLIHMGAGGLLPLLEALREKTDSIWLREGSHHIIHDLVSRELVDEPTRKSLMPVLDALNHINPVIEANTAADNAIKTIYFK